jgi:hypothetical protein
VFTVLALVLLAGLLALALWQFGRIGQLDRSRWTPFLQLSYLRFLTVGFIGTIVATALALIYVVVNFALSQLAVWLERRGRHPHAPQRRRVRRCRDAHAGSVGQDRSRAVDSGMTVKTGLQLGTVRSTQLSWWRRGRK